jgi:hypothetical protein
MKRKPVVAGTFYPGSERVLRQTLEDIVPHVKEKKKVIGIVSPHAGYVYSGGCAGKVFAAVQVPDYVIILGVNHQGMGHPYAVDGHDHWATPLGDIEICRKLRQQLTENSEIFEVDTLAGSREHSLEVQVPFIQFLNPRAKILPITIASSDFQGLRAGGKELARLISDRDDVLIVASSDMSHYIAADMAKEQDAKAIEKILSLDPEGLFNTVAKEHITMCGIAPTTMMLTAALELEAQKAEVIDYTHSGIVSGDDQQVVAYLGLIVY